MLKRFGNKKVTAHGVMLLLLVSAANEIRYEFKPKAAAYFEPIWLAQLANAPSVKLGLGHFIHRRKHSLVECLYYPNENS